MVNIDQLNADIAQFPQVFPITPDMTQSLTGVSRTVMLDRYAFKDTEKKTLKTGDFVVLTVKEDPKWPTRGLGFIRSLRADGQAIIEVEEEFRGVLEGKEAETGRVTRSLSVVEKPLELYYEQIAMRNATGLTRVEGEENQNEWFEAFAEELKAMNFVPAGRVLYGAGSGSDVTFFNCYVMPFPADSREGISEHRKQVMEIMSRGGGVGTNGSTLRPRNTLARGVNGKSSGAVSWLDDIAKLTHLVEQGGSRRGAQMIMMADWHPDVIEFIISKMQNPKILRYLIQHTNDPEIKAQAERKLKFNPLSEAEKEMLSFVSSSSELPASTRQEARQTLKDGGRYDVHNVEFLTGANISVNLTKEFMDAVENGGTYALRFPATESYTPEQMKAYNETWHEVGDVREWEAAGYPVRTHRVIEAKELWNLINICATYSAEPGIFFIDNANDKTNAKAYGQKVVATNPCGEQPLAPYSVCNLAAVNLANFSDPATKTVNIEALKRTVARGVRMQDNVIDSTPYFLEANKTQALGERRVGLGVMGLADLLILCEKEYGSEEGNRLVDHVFEVLATTAYRTSIELAKEKGSFPFLIGSTDEETMALREAFVNTGYMKQMPEDIRDGIRRHGIRNSHLLTVAPTGSTGTMVGVGTGLEPYFAFSYYRSGRLGKFIEVKADIVQRYLDAHPEADPDHLPHWFISSMQLTPEAHADVQCIIQRWVDSSISKTVNAPKGYTVEQVQGVYERLYHGGAKGGTVYVDGSRDAQVLSLTAEENDLDATHDDYDADVLSSPDEVASVLADIVYGNEIGDRCPICREGEVKEIGGCNTCDQCGMQLKCGL